ncbi:hypothetical protein N9N92_01910 [Planktomarina temperata]|nr:hypothetical protein [Planktomarina temperata]
MRQSFKINQMVPLTILVISMTLLLLAPYTIYGRPDMIVAAGFISYGLFSCRGRIPKSLIRDNVILFAVLGISLYGALISNFFHVTPQIHHPRVIFSLIVVYWSFWGITRFCDRRILVDINFEKLLINICLFNSCIILLQFFSSDFRQLVESFFVQFNLRYDVGFKYRGIASAGGAGLSVFQAIAFTMLLFQISEKKITYIKGIIIGFTIFFATLLIGRTGTVFMILFSIIFSFRSWKILFASTFLVLLTWTFYEAISEIMFNDFHGTNVLFYSLGFLFQSNGLNEEGTLRVLNEYWFFPNSPNILWGYGFYGIGKFEPWTDSGYIRSVLSVGLPLASLKYCLLLILFYNRCGKSVMMFFLLSILLIAEIKEPFLISGFGIRLFLALMIYNHYYKSNSMVN